MSKFLVTSRFDTSLRRLRRLNAAMVWQLRHPVAVNSDSLLALV